MMHIGYRSTMRGSCFMEYYDQIRIIYGVRECLCWRNVPMKCRRMNAWKQARALTNIKQQTNINIDSTEQTVFDILLPRKQLCMHAVRFILSIRLALVHLSMCMAYKQNKNNKTETEFSIFTKNKQTNMRNKQTNVYARSKNTRWTNGTVASLTVKRWKEQREKNYIFKRKMCA